MLAGLFYTRAGAPPQKVEKPKESGNSSVCNPDEVNDEGNVLRTSEHVHPRGGNNFPENTSIPPHHQQPRSGKFISSADIFGIDTQDMPPPSIKKQSKSGLILDFELSIDKLKALLLGWLIRKRMKSDFASDLIKKIKSFDSENSGSSGFYSLEVNSSFRKSYYVAQLLSFLNNGIKKIKNDDMKYTTKKNRPDLSYKQNHEVENVSTTLEKKQQLDFTVYSSNKAKQRKEDVLASLREATGMKDSSIPSLLEDITPKFLAERRSVFLQTIFSPGEREECIAPIPRFDAMKGWENLDVNRSLTSMYGGGYHRVIEHLDRFSLSLQ
ncbi:hypothetical protein LSM04_008789 [Trypanosoma melophagium]|uniref:uncharacterized protein n=1 Tax=Trypanosoma melophagium TaxID=715481 RepID=UPI00351A5C2B|nr:hypothetical protein LSM04_008789 [Trypanosoma melophagium]